MKYSEIKTMDQLEKARKQVRNRINKKGDDVKASFYDMKESYSPSHLMVSGLKSFSSYIPVDQLLLTTVRRIKRKLLK
ncbi:MAG: hypothetical protein IK076_03945 [Bacteroidales bacterium]|nr:hypothetical protein [Bacteroidales bacterium]